MLEDASILISSESSIVLLFLLYCFLKSKIIFLAYLLVTGSPVMTNLLQPYSGNHDEAP